MHVYAVCAQILRGPLSHIWISNICPTYECVMSDMCRGNSRSNSTWPCVTHMNESCPTYEWVMSHTYECVISSSHSPVSHEWMSDATNMNESCPTYKCVMSNICRHSLYSNSTRGPVSLSWMSHVTHMNESCHTHVNEWCRTYEWVMCHLWMCHVTLMNEWNESCHIYGWVMSHMRRHHAFLGAPRAQPPNCNLSHTWTSHVPHTYKL